MRKENICRRYCEKTGDCLLDKIESEMPLEDDYEIVEDLKVAMPSRAKAFKLVLKDARERLDEEFEQWGDVIQDKRQREVPITVDDYDFETTDETFIWSDSIVCSKATANLGPYVISTEIHLTGMRTSVELLDN
jgi:hypothetical protein